MVWVIKTMNAFGSITFPITYSPSISNKWTQNRRSWTVWLNLSRQSAVGNIRQQWKVSQTWRISTRTVIKVTVFFTNHHNGAPYTLEHASTVWNPWKLQRTSLEVLRKVQSIWDTLQKFRHQPSRLHLLSFRVRVKESVSRTDRSPSPIQLLLVSKWTLTRVGQGC